jgi:hypothetical protein
LFLYLHEVLMLANVEVIQYLIYCIYVIVVLFSEIETKKVVQYC